jgi:hypothetical protein
LRRFSGDFQGGHIAFGTARTVGGPAILFDHTERQIGFGFIKFNDLCGKYCSGAGVFHKTWHDLRVDGDRRSTQVIDCGNAQLRIEFSSGSWIQAALWRPRRRGGVIESGNSLVLPLPDRPFLTLPRKGHRERCGRKSHWRLIRDRLLPSFWHCPLNWPGDRTCVPESVL